MRAIFVVLILLFEALDQNKIVEGFGIGSLMLNLGRRLICREGRGRSGMRIRMDDRLSDEKLKVYGIKAPDGHTKEQKSSANGLSLEQPDASKSTMNLKLKSKKSRLILVTVEEFQPKTTN